MSGRDEEPRDSAIEARLRFRLRAVAGGVVIGLIAFMSVVATIAPFLGQSDVHISEFVFGTLAGVLCLILGVEVPAWLRRR